MRKQSIVVSAALASALGSLLVALPVQGAEKSRRIRSPVKTF
jgi:hypothetical protein